MNKEETQKAKDELNRLGNSLPSGIEFVGGYIQVISIDYCL
jgi:hypothetical protein